jgi:hypothetical protein
MKLEAKKLSVTHGLGSESILINQTRIFLNFETQTSKLGRPFRQSGLRKKNQLPSKWIDKVEKWHWVYSFKYLDERGGFFEVEIDYNNKFLSLIKL